MRFTHIHRFSCLYIFLRACQIVLRCSVWSSTLPSRQMSSPWSPLRSSTSSAKPTRVRTWRETQKKKLFFYVADCRGDELALKSKIRSEKMIAYRKHLFLLSAFNLCFCQITSDFSDLTLSVCGSRQSKISDRFPIKEVKCINMTLHH